MFPYTVTGMTNGSLGVNKYAVKPRAKSKTRCMRSGISSIFRDQRGSVKNEAIDNEDRST